jgi:Flp pilus assembly protein TadD
LEEVFVSKLLNVFGLTIILIGLGMLSGCSTLSGQIAKEADVLDVFKGPQPEHVYKAGYDKTFRTCVDVMRRVDNGSAKLVRYSEGIIVFQRPGNDGTLTVNVSKIDGDTTRVEMSAKINRKYWFDESDDATKRLFFEGLDNILGSHVASAHDGGSPQESADTPGRIKNDTKTVPASPGLAAMKSSETASAGTQKTAKDTEEKDILLAKLGQALELPGEGSFLRKLSVEELTTLEERIELFEQKIDKQNEMSGKCASCYIDLARLFHDSGQYARAAEALKAAVAIDPENAVAHCNLGEIYKHLNLIDDAIRELEVAKGLNPDLADIYINLGIIYDDYAANDKKALECYRQYLALGGSDPQVLDWIKAIEKGS